MASVALQQILPGRTCGGCTMCCKVMEIPELEKPRDVWCGHCAIGKGCTIYEERPPSCRAFICGYLVWPMAQPHWYPSKSKMVISSDETGSQIIVHVDPFRATSWRAQPYLADLKAWARQGGPATQVLVRIGAQTIAVLPDGEVDLGVVASDDRIVTFPEGRGRWRIEKLRPDDPRLARAAVAPQR